MAYLSTEIKNTELPGATQIELFVNEDGTSDLKELQHRVNVFMSQRKEQIKVLDVKLTATESNLGEKHYTVMVIYEVK